MLYELAIDPRAVEVDPLLQSQEVIDATFKTIIEGIDATTPEGVKKTVETTPMMKFGGSGDGNRFSLHG